MTADVGAGPAAPLAVAFAQDVSARPLTAEERSDLVEGLLDQYPEASVMAPAETGRLRPIPAGVPLTTHRPVTGHDTALELVAPADIVNVIETWKRATQYGLGVCVVSSLDDADTQLTMYFVDVRERFGTFIGICVTPDGSPLTGSRGDRDGLRPRLTVVRKTRLAEFLDVDDAFPVLLGHGRDEIRGRRNLDLIHPDDQARAIANWVDLLGHPGGVRQVRLRHQHADGHWVWFEVTNHNRLDDPAEACVVTEMIDVSEEMAAQEELRASQQLLVRLTEALPVGVVQLDHDRRVVYSNARAQQILASRDPSTLAGLFAGVVTDDLPALDEACEAVLGRGVGRALELSVRHPRRNLLRCRVTLRPLTNDSEVTGAIACVDDITEPARLRAQLEFRATYDALTGCLNRASLLAELDQALAEARVEGTGTAVAFVDLDGFKGVNDSQGHRAGDRLLQEIAGQLVSAARRGDVVGRVGGDEFIVVGRGVGSADQALAIAQRLADGLAAHVDPQPGLRAAASIGVAWAPAAAAESADQLVARADHAMYDSKRAGHGRPVLG